MVLPSKDFSSKPEVTYAAKTKKVISPLIIVFSALLLTTLSLIGYYYYELNKTDSVPEKNWRLWKSYISTDRIGRVSAQELSKADCFETSEVIGGQLTYPYLEDLKKEILLETGIKEEAIGLFFLYDPVPDTQTCWLIWVVDRNGVGVVGYRNKSRELAVYDADYSREALDEMLNREMSGEQK